MTTAKWTINTRAQQHLPYPAATFNEKGVCQFGVEMLLVCKENFKFSLGIFKSPPLAKISCLQFQ